MFDQRLDPAFYDRVQDAVCAHAHGGARARRGARADHPEDVAYLTGFFHHPGERPVGVLLERRRTGRAARAASWSGSTPQSQQARRRDGGVPGVPGRAWRRSRCSRRRWPARPRRLRRDSHERLAASRAATRCGAPAGTDARHPSPLRQGRRRRSRCTSEAARITDRMLEAGRALVRDAVAAGGELPTRGGARRVTSTVVGAGTMYAEHRERGRRRLLAGGLVYAGANSASRTGCPPATGCRPGGHLHAVARLRGRRPVRRGRAHLHPRRADRRPAPLLRGGPRRAADRASRRCAPG